MFFKAKGKYVGRDVEVKWENGALEGDHAAIEYLKFIAELREGQFVVVPGLLTGTTDFLDDPYLSSRLLETDVLDEFSIVEHDLPELEPDIPKGAVI